MGALPFIVHGALPYMVHGALPFMVHKSREHSRPVHEAFPTGERRCRDV